MSEEQQRKPDVEFVDDVLAHAMRSPDYAKIAIPLLDPKLMPTPAHEWAASFIRDTWDAHQRRVVPRVQCRCSFRSECRRWHLLVLASGYNEVVPVDVLEPAGLTKSIERRPGDLIRRTAEDAHRVVLRRDEHGRPIPAWSLFVTGKLRRTWGFWCPKGWRHYKKFVELKIDSEGRGVSSVGRGCDD